MVNIRFAKDRKEVVLAYELAAKIFGPNYFAAEHSFVINNKLDEIRDLSRVIVAEENNKIVGLIRVIDRELYFGKNLLRTAGITNVCVHPLFRGGGISRKMMGFTHRALKEQDYDIAILIARKAVDGFYNKFGYIGVGCFSEILLSKPAWDAVKIKKRFRFKRGIQNQWLQKYNKVYHASYGSIKLAFCRNKKWWKTMRQRFEAKIKPYDFVNVFSGTRFIGYFILQNARLIEMASRQKDMLGLYEAIICYFKKQRQDELLVALPESHTGANLFKKLNHSQKTRRVWDGAHMIRVINDSKISPRDCLLCCTNWSLIDEV